jgi:heme-degrading monooxygenase HmoA
MILEHVDIHIVPGKSSEFEAAIAHGLSTIHTQATGMRGYRVDRCIESAERYIMQIWWDSIDDHMVGYRQGPLSPAFRALIESFLAQTPVMQHFESVVQYPALAADVG